MFFVNKIIFVILYGYSDTGDLIIYYHTKYSLNENKYKLQLFYNIDSCDSKHQYCKDYFVI